jgi:hypothetical protein
VPRLRSLSGESPTVREATQIVHVSKHVTRHF